MTPPEANDVTTLLERWQGGDQKAFDELLPLVYEELRKVANAYLRKERQDLTLQTTDLVHEAYLRLGNLPALDTENRSHFFAIAARAMRRILVDHARLQKADKRVGAHRRRPLEEANAAFEENDPNLVLAIHHALEELAETHPRPARLVELRFFGGLTESEAATALDTTRSTANRDWRFARLWLYRRLEK